MQGDYSPMGEVGDCKPPMAHRFQKGKSGNPLGGQLHNKDLKAIRQLTAKELAEVGSVIVKGDRESLKRIVDDPSSSILQIWIASVASKAINKGDCVALNGLLDRIVGKAPNNLTISGPGGGPIQMQAMTDEEATRRARELLREIEECGEPGAREPE